MNTISAYTCRPLPCSLTQQPIDFGRADWWKSIHV